MDRKEYLEERRELVRMEMEAYGSFDRILLAVSSGAIGLSVALIGKFHHPACIALLIASWLLWFVSICAQIGSFLFTSKAMRDEQTILGEQYKNYDRDARENKYSGIPSTFNNVALGAFILGALSFLVFIISNLHHVNR